MGGGGGGGGSRLSVIMTLTVGNMICESPLRISICRVKSTSRSGRTTCVCGVIDLYLDIFLSYFYQWALLHKRAIKMIRKEWKVSG